jgi:D-aspartate ligase
MPIRRRPEASGALVLGANYRGLGVVRSLGRRGVPVWLVRSDEHLVACASRYVHRSLAWPNGDDGARVAYLVELARRHSLSGWTLFPTDDETAALLARHRTELGRCFRVAAPTHRAMRAAYDKRLTHGVAEGLGIPQPRTWFPAGRPDAAMIDCRFPVILKPAFKASSNRFTDAKAWRVDDRASLMACYDEARTLVPPDILMVQELIPGGGGAQLSYTALCDEGRVIASASATRLRQQPMDFGKSSSYVETTPDCDAAVAARELLAQLRFDGLVEVEFKRDARDGRAKLLDINARAWGWHTLCARAGVDFTWLYWSHLHGEPVRQTQAEPGVRWVRMSTDLPAVLRELRAGRMRAREYFKSLRGPLEFAIYAHDDPAPALADLPLLALVAARRTLRRRRASLERVAPPMGEGAA